MKFRRLVPALLAASLSLNGAMIGYLTWSGGLKRFFLRLDLIEFNPPREDYPKELEGRYRKLPDTRAEVVFAGDSLVSHGPWAELLTEVHNRGIEGDTVAALLGRLDEITQDKPRRAFLLLGANDLGAAVPEVQILRNYRTILERFRRESPETVVTVIGTLPINSTFLPPPGYTNAQVASLNARLKGLVDEFPGVRFLDLTAFLVDDTGNLRREFTTDGLHMTVDGYLAIHKPIKEAAER